MPPYSYGLAARARRIYNGLACSGGQGGCPSRRTLTTGGYEARAPRHSGPRLLFLTTGEQAACDAHSSILIIENRKTRVVGDAGYSAARAQQRRRAALNRSASCAFDALPPMRAAVKIAAAIKIAIVQRFFKFSLS